MPHVRPRIGFAGAALAIVAGAAGCNGQVAGAANDQGEAPESALTSAKMGASQRSAATYSGAVVIEPDDAYAETCTGVLIAPRVVVTAAHCVAFVRSKSWRVTAPFATSGVETRTARDGAPMDAAFMNATREDYADRDLPDVGVVYLDTPFTSVETATLAPAAFAVEKSASPIHVSSVGRSDDGIEAGLALSPVTTLESAGSRAAIAYTTERVTADGESGGPLFVEGSQELVAVHARVLAEGGAERDLWTRLDGDVYTWLTQKVTSHGGWTAPSPR